MAEPFCTPPPIRWCQRIAIRDWKMLIFTGVLVVCVNVGHGVDSKVLSESRLCPRALDCLGTRYATLSAGPMDAVGAGGDGTPGNGRGSRGLGSVLTGAALPFAFVPSPSSLRCGLARPASTAPRLQALIQPLSPRPWCPRPHAPQLLPWPRRWHLL
ncbi:hypothetical protein B0H10DRAFT_2066606 [Mycena sp. CBHHK59/15]|nr:hypothetical protein B0H10DRAFT_2066606 [Mycena sp. CBHHK59/15]